jgi:titin
VGGTSAALRNVISGNVTGVILANGTQSVIGNYIGLDTNGLLALPNSGNGISVTGGSAHTIGGTNVNQRNFISGNTGNGVDISGGSAIVRANYIGLNTAGDSTGNNIGVNITSTDASTVGGNTTAMRNFISGNQYGISISNGTQTVQGNFIGTDILGTSSLGNLADGILITGGSDHLIGGLTSAERNVISGNVANGINITDGNAIIKSNRIGTNTGGSAALANYVGINISSSAETT